MLDEAGTAARPDGARAARLGQADLDRRRAAAEHRGGSSCSSPPSTSAKSNPRPAAINGVRAIVARLNEAEAEPVTVRLSGSVAMEHEELASVSASAGIGGHRDAAPRLRHPLCRAAFVASARDLGDALFAGLAYTAAFAAATVGHLNLLSIMFVVLNVGLGADYVIHVLLRYRELVAEGYAAEPALLETMRGVGSSLLLAAFTTAAGFYAFIPTQFQGVAELGWIAGTGIFFGFIAATTLLPALVAQFASSLRVQSARTVLDPRIFVPFNRHPRAVLGVATVVIVASAVALRWVSFDSNPIHLRDPKSESVETLLELAASGDAQLLNLEAVAPDHATATRVGRGLARPARDPQRDHDRLARAERPGREDRGARRSEARHGSVVRAAQTAPADAERLAASLDALEERFGRPARQRPRCMRPSRDCARRSPRNRPRMRRDGWPRSITR